MEQPTRAQQACMIYKPATRILEDGCDWCGKSEVFCHANRRLDGNCCGKCTHPTDQLDHGTTTLEDTPG